MRRAFVAVLALLASVFVQPVSAAPRTYVYEIVRLNAKAWPSAYVRTRPGGGGGPSMSMLIEPDGDGGYRMAMIDASPGPAGGGGTIDLSKGRRYFVASSGPVKFHINERYWAARLVGNGFRWVSRDPGATREVAGVRYEQFDRAVAPGGRYGSVAFATVPCDAGVGAWTLRADSDPEPLAPTVCAGGADRAFAQTRTGRSWILEGPVLGTSSWAYRLMVLDFPRP